MKKVLFTILTAFFLAGISFAQTSAQTEGSMSASQDTTVSHSGNSAQAQSDTAAQGRGDAAVSTPSRSAAASTSNQSTSSKTVRATLEKPIDARKNRPGDEVLAKTTQATSSEDGVVIPRGSKVIGHVTEAKAKSKVNGETQSAVGIVFDHAVLKNGRQVPLNASIQAISSSQQNAAASAFEDEPVAPMAGAGATGSAAGNVRSAGRGLPSTAGSVAGGATSTIENTPAAVSTGAAGTLKGAGSVPNGAASSSLSSASHGVAGLNGLSLSSAAANSTEGSVISSASRNVHLDSGTEMILQVTK